MLLWHTLFALRSTFDRYHHDQGTNDMLMSMVVVMRVQGANPFSTSFEVLFSTQAVVLNVRFHVVEDRRVLHRQGAYRNLLVSVIFGFNGLNLTRCHSFRAVRMVVRGVSTSFEVNLHLRRVVNRGVFVHYQDSFNRRGQVVSMRVELILSYRVTIRTISRFVSRYVRLVRQVLPVRRSVQVHIMNAKEVDSTTFPLVLGPISPAVIGYFLRSDRVILSGQLGAFRNFFRHHLSTMFS